MGALPMSKEEYIEKINEIISKVDDLWILNQICRFSVNMTKESEAFDNE